MKKTREQLKAELLKGIEEKLDEVVEWAEAHPQANLTEIENYLLGVDETIRETLTREVMKHKESRQAVNTPLCGACGGQTQYKGMEAKNRHYPAGSGRNRAGLLLVQRL